MIVFFLILFLGVGCRRKKNTVNVFGNELDTTEFERLYKSLDAHPNKEGIFGKEGFSFAYLSNFFRKSLENFVDATSPSKRERRDIDQQVLERKKDSEKEKGKNRLRRNIESGRRYGEDSGNPCDRPMGINDYPYSAWVIDTVETFICNGTNYTATEYNELSNEVKDTCTSDSHNETVCICSATRRGTYCERWRTFDCIVDRISPEDDCLIPEKGKYEEGGLTLFGYHNCLRFQTTDKVNFTFTMNCTFSEPPSEETDYDIDTDSTLVEMETGLSNRTWEDISASFEYFYSYPSYAEDSLEIDFALHFDFSSEITMNFRPYNFRRLGDRTGFTKLHIFNRTDIYNEQSAFSHIVDFSIFPTTFFSGNRFYFEMGPSVWQPMKAIQSKVMVDFTDLEVPKKKKNYLAIIISVPLSVLVGCCCFVCLTGYFVMRLVKYRKRVIKRRRKKKEEEERKKRIAMGVNVDEDEDVLFVKNLAMEEETDEEDEELRKFQEGEDVEMEDMIIEKKVMGKEEEESSSGDEDDEEEEEEDMGEASLRDQFSREMMESIEYDD